MSSAWAVRCVDQIERRIEQACNETDNLLSKYTLSEALDLKYAERGKIVRHIELLLLTSATTETIKEQLNQLDLIDCSLLILRNKIKEIQYAS